MRPESRLEIARRNVREAEERVKRMKDLLADLRAMDSPLTSALSLLSLAEETLRQMRASLAAMEIRGSDDAADSIQSLRYDLGPYTLEFKCPRCGQRGTAVWEKSGGKEALLNLSAGFYERMPKNARNFKIELVCDCGAVQPIASGPVSN